MANEYKNGEDSEFDGGFFSGAGKDVLHSDIKIDVDDDNYPDRPLDEIEVISEENIMEYPDEDCDKLLHDPADEVCLDSFRNSVTLQGRVYFKGHMKVFDNTKFSTKRAHYNILIKRKTKNGIRGHLIYARSFGDAIVDRLQKLRLGAWIRVTGNVEAYKGQNYIKVSSFEEVSKEQLSAMYGGADYYGKIYDGTDEIFGDTVMQAPIEPVVQETETIPPMPVFAKQENTDKSVSPLLQGFSEIPSHPEPSFLNDAKRPYYSADFIEENETQEIYENPDEIDEDEIERRIRSIMGFEIVEELNARYKNEVNTPLEEKESETAANDVEDSVPIIQPHSRRMAEYAEAHEEEHDPDSWGVYKEPVQEAQPKPEAESEENTKPDVQETIRNEEPVVPKEHHTYIRRQENEQKPEIRRPYMPAGTGMRRIIRKDTEEEKPKFKSRFS